MSEARTFTPREITHYLIIGFAGPLLVSTVAFILYGIICYQFWTYVQGSAKKDPTLTWSWVFVVMFFTTVATSYQVWYNWLYSIEFFTPGVRKVGITNGNVVLLYSVVVMLVQMFWLVCADAAQESRRNLWIVGPIAAVSSCSFLVAIAVAAFSAAEIVPNSAWPSPTVSILLRVVLGLDLGVDLSILSLMLAQLHRMRGELGHLRRNFSRLTYIFASMASLSTCIIIAELVINVPQSGNGTSLLKITLTFAPVIPPLYMLSMLSILNSRDSFWAQQEAFSLEVEEADDGDIAADGRPQMKSTNQVCSRGVLLRSHAATEPAIDVEREAESRRSSLAECHDQRRYSNDGNADQIQSTQFGIQSELDEAHWNDPVCPGGSLLTSLSSFSKSLKPSNFSNAPDSRTNCVLTFNSPNVK